MELLPLILSATGQSINVELTHTLGSIFCHFGVAAVKSSIVHSILISNDWGSDPMDNRLKYYWRRNLKYVGSLLLVWFVVSFGCGILFVEQLNRIRIGGFQLGFWFAQQGSIYVFVVLIFVYVWLTNRLDREFDVDEERS